MGLQTGHFDCYLDELDNSTPALGSLSEAPLYPPSKIFLSDECFPIRCSLNPRADDYSTSRTGQKALILSSVVMGEVFFSQISLKSMPTGFQSVSCCFASHEQCPFSYDASPFDRFLLSQDKNLTGMT